jgi:mobilome CxxCx(11)CxxC protein
VAQGGQVSGEGSERSQLKNEIWDRQFYAFATAAIFEYRARRLKKRLRWLNFIALVVPVIVGGLALAYGAGFRLLGFVVAVGAAVGVVQLVISTWSETSGWVESYGFAITSVVENQRLARDFKALGEDTSSNLESLRNQNRLLKAMDDARQAQDYTQEISEEEKRIGHRAALIARQKKCTACNEVPTSMNPTNCGVCGNFKLKTI